MRQPGASTTPSKTPPLATQSAEFSITNLEPGTKPPTHFSCV